jgi:hypothetical protein
MQQHWAASLLHLLRAALQLPQVQHPRLWLQLVLLLLPPLLPPLLLLAVGGCQHTAATSSGWSHPQAPQSCPPALSAWNAWTNTSAAL